MRTVRTKVYKFSELSEQAKTKAIEQFRDINVMFQWWDSTYEDAKNIGIEITGFDLDRKHITGNLMDGLTESCHRIIWEHGDTCDTYKTAKSYLKEWNQLVSEHSDGINKFKVAEDKADEFDELANELEIQFLHSICEDYRIMLQKEYDYLTSEEAIIETIEANEYEFTKDGKQF